MHGREKFLNSSNKELDRILESEKRYHDYRIEAYKRFWKSFILNPYIVLGFILTFIIILISGYYYDWYWKYVIEKIFAYGLVSVLTGIIQYIITKKIESRVYENN